MKSHINIVSKYCIAIVTLIIFWEIIAFIFDDPRILPNLIYLVKVSLPRMSVFHDEIVLADSLMPKYKNALLVLSYNSIVSIGRILIGLLIGISTGVIVGMGLHFFKYIKKTSFILLKLLRGIPLLALIPLFVHWFGTKEIGILIYISFAVFVIIASNTYEAVFNVSESLINQAKVFGATKFKIYKEVVFHSILQELIASTKNVVGLVWAFSLGAEYLASDSGLGNLVYHSYQKTDMGFLMILTINYCILGFSCFVLLRFYLNKKIEWIKN